MEIAEKERDAKEKEKEIAKKYPKLKLPPRHQYTAPEAREFFRAIYEISKAEPKYLSFTDFAEFHGVPVDRIKHLANRKDWGDDETEVKYFYNLTKNIFENRLKNGSLNQRLNAFVAMRILQNNYGFVEKKAVEMSGGLALGKIAQEAELAEETGNENNQ